MAFILFWVAALLLWVGVPSFSTEQQQLYGAITLLVVAAIGMLAPPIHTAFSLQLLQRAAEAYPSLFAIAERDRGMRCSSFLAFFASTLAFIIAVDWLWLGTFPHKLLLGAFLAAMATAMGALRCHCRQLINYLDPFRALSLIEKRAKQYATTESSQELCDLLGALCDAAARGMSLSQSTLASAALRHIAKVALATFSPKCNRESQQYILFYLLGQLDSMHQCTVEERQEFLGCEVMSCSGKIALHLGKNDAMLAVSPLQSIGKWAMRGQRATLSAAGVKGSYLLFEITKELMEGPSMSEELREPLLCALGEMAEVARTAFRQDKKTSIALLMQPLRDLKQLVERGTAAPALRSALLVAIQNVLDEFDALQVAMCTLPPLPTSGGPCN